MEQIARLPARRTGGLRATWRWIIRPRTIRLSPLGALAIAAVFVAVVLWRPHRPSSPASAPAFGVVVVAPRAATLSLVGGFNDWDAAPPPLQRTRQDEAAWTAPTPFTPRPSRPPLPGDGA